jgi:trigger factor
MLEAIPAGSSPDDEPRSVPVRIGENQIGPGFDELLEDVAAGDEFRARMESSADGSPGAAPHLFRVLEVRESVLPELDDELARKVADVDSLEELREKVGESIGKRHDDEMSYLRERQALDAILEKNPFDPPGYMVENLSGDFMSRLNEEDPSEETRKAVKEMAAKKVREFLLLRAIALKEGIEVPDERIEEEKSPEESRASVLDRLRNRAAVEHVISHATITPMKPEETPGTGEGGQTPEPEWKWVRVTGEGDGAAETAPEGSEEG